MSRIQIGIPVYNGAPMVNESLDCLVNQDFKDLNIHISDNFSSDGTNSICQNWEKLDSRIYYTRQSENIGPLKNFKFLLENCKSEYFMWRADDDYSSSNYISTLVDLLESNKSAQLAVPKVRTEHENGFVPWYEFDEIKGHLASERITDRFYRYHASWFYGVWRTEYLKKISSRIWSIYPYAYAGDHLIILSAILDEIVVGSNDAEFTQRTFSPNKGDGLRGKISIEKRIMRLKELMPKFYDCFEKEVEIRDFPPSERKILLQQKKKFTYEKLRASPFRLLRLRAKRLIQRN